MALKISHLFSRSTHLGSIGITQNQFMVYAFYDKVIFEILKLYFKSESMYVFIRVKIMSYTFI